MEERRLIIVMLLILILTFFFMTLSPSHPPQPQKTSQTTPTKQKTIPRPQPQPPEPKQKGKGPEKGLLKTRSIVAEWSRDDGLITILKLTEKQNGRYIYPSPESKEKPLTLVHPLKNVGCLKIVEPAGLVFSSRRTEKGVVLTAQNEQITLTKTFLVSDDPLHRYDITFTLELRNRTDKPLQLEKIVLVACCGLGREAQSRGYEGGVVCKKPDSEYDLEETSVESIDKEKPTRVEGPFWYFGLANKYFAFVLIPEGRMPLKEVCLRRLTKHEKPEGFDPKRILDAAVEAVLGPVQLPPKSGVRYEFTIFAGPRAEEALGVHRAVGLDRLVSYGFFGFLSRIFLAILSAIHWLLPNWGVAIIILTLIVRGALHPVSRKQQVALIRYQHKLRQIQPEMEKIRKKYHNDRRRMNEEIMKLFRKHKVPMVPAGGCLLMLLQIPVFIGLYQALNRSIVLRQTSFLWISDLAQPDRLFKLPFTIPLIGAEYFNLLPVLTLVVMILQTKIQQGRLPSAQQGQTFTYFMYAFLTFILYNLPSGLILYFFASTALGLVEGWLVRRYIERAHPELVTA